MSNRRLDAASHSSNEPQLRHQPCYRGALTILWWCAVLIAAFNIFNHSNDLIVEYNRC